MRKPQWVKRLEDCDCTYAEYANLQKVLADNKISLRHKGEDFAGGFFGHSDPGVAKWIGFTWGLGVLVRYAKNPSQCLADCLAMR